MSSNSNTSPADIITYGGIPLAVIGVLPTLYIFFRAIMTLRDIRRTFARNHVVAITRPSTLAGLVEVELPRLSLAPLDRSDPLYFGANAQRSALRGGSWTAVHWREMRVGTASYRVQYHDQLRQPAADADFESVVAFLLDRGAVPDACGWADLREAGLWTPTGTVLLRSPAGRGHAGGESVLRTTTSEDSDGLLALVLNWEPEWDSRSVDDLPPYWMRIRAPVAGKPIEIGVPARDADTSMNDVSTLKPDSDDDLDEKTATDAHVDEKSAAQTEVVSVPGAKASTTASHTAFLTASVDASHARRHSVSSFRSHRSYHSRHGHNHVEHLTSLPASTPSLRLRLSPTGLSTLLTEPVQMPLYAPHILPPHPLASFFSAACSALAHLPATADDLDSGGLLWSHTPPATLLSLALTPSIPQGILALLDIEPSTTWRSPEHQAKLATAHELAQLTERQRRETQLRAMMSEGQLRDAAARQRAAMERMQREMTERRFEAERLRVERARADEVEVQEAVGSRRVGVARVAAACRAYLVRMDLVDEEEASDDVDERAALAALVERLLWECVRRAEVADAVGGMLAQWKLWVEAGGITRDGYELLRGKKVEFCYAACLLGLVGEMSSGDAGSVGSDMQECLRLWKKIRLG